MDIKTPTLAEAIEAARQVLDHAISVTDQLALPVPVEMSDRCLDAFARAAGFPSLEAMWEGATSQTEAARLAAEAEREACARVAEDDENWLLKNWQIAAAIRARKEGCPNTPRRSS